MNYHGFLYMYIYNINIRIYKPAILPFVFYGCETWSCALRQKQKLQIFGNTVLKKMFASSVVECRRLRWLGHIAVIRGSRVRFPAGAGNFSLHPRDQNGSGAHSAYHPVSTGSSFPGIKRLGREADHSPPSSTEVKECVELYLHSPNTSSWRGA
jgi:hypothetical protein